MLHGIFQAILIGGLVIVGMAFLLNLLIGFCKKNKK